MLGSGDAFSSHGRFMSGYFIDAGARILLEAGPTVLTALKRAGVSAPDIDLVLISHPHGDHFGGLPFLLLEYMWEKPRTTILTIAGPRNLEARTWRLFRTMYPGSDISRIARWIRFEVIEPGDSRRIGPARVTAIRTPHMTRDKSLAFRIEVGGRTIAFSGDSGWTEELVPLCVGADLFLCEATLAHGDLDGQPRGHLSLTEAETAFEASGAGTLLVTHRPSELPVPHNRLLAFDGLQIDV